MPFSFEEGPAQTGQSISLTCSVVDGDLPLYINWFLNDKPTEDILGLSQAKIGRRISVLSIESVEADHAGQFTCRAINKAGQTESSAELKVNGIDHQMLKCSIKLLLDSKNILSYVYSTKYARSIELPVILPLSLSTEASNEGDYVQLTCVVTKGDLPITFTWSLNDQPITNALASTVDVGRQTR